jgi:hypothetical protein
MTKKDYIKFADLLIRLYKDSKTDNEREMLEMVRSGIGDIFFDDNNRFSYDKFNDYITDKTQ